MPRRPSHPAAVGLICLLLLGCGAAFADPAREGEPIQTDRLEYDAVWVNGVGTYAQYAFVIIARFRNVTGRTLYLSGECAPGGLRPAWFVRMADPADPRESAYGYGCAGLGNHPYLTIGPGETRVDTFQVVGPTGWERTGEPLGELEGLFRLAYDARWCPDCFDLAPDSVSISNTFEIGLVR